MGEGQTFIKSGSVMLGHVQIIKIYIAAQSILDCFTYCELVILTY